MPSESGSVAEVVQLHPEAQTPNPSNRGGNFLTRRIERFFTHVPPTKDIAEVLLGEGTQVPEQGAEALFATTFKSRLDFLFAQAARPNSPTELVPQEDGGMSVKDKTTGKILATDYPEQHDPHSKAKTVVSKLFIEQRNSLYEVTWKGWPNGEYTDQFSLAKLKNNKQHGKQYTVGGEKQSGFTVDYAKLPLTSVPNIGESRRGDFRAADGSIPLSPKPTQKAA